MFQSFSVFAVSRKNSAGSIALSFDETLDLFRFGSTASTNNSNLLNTSFAVQVDFQPTSRVDFSLGSAESGTPGNARFVIEMGAGPNPSNFDQTLAPQEVTCGNGTIQPGEGCDDGVRIAGDGCSPLCLIENDGPCATNAAGAVGDLSCDSGVCDDTETPDRCEAANVCGNGTVENAETCDDGNTTGGDGCSSSCALEVPSITITASPTSVNATQTSTVTFTLSVDSSDFDLADVGVFDVDGDPIAGLLTGFQSTCNPTTPCSTYEALFTPPQGTDATLEIRVDAGAFSNASAITNAVGDSELVTVDTISPTIAINIIASDDILNASEVAAGVTVSGTTSDVENGQTVTLTLNGESFTAVVTESEWSVFVPDTSLGALDASEVVGVSVTDVAGNPATASRTITIDTEAPEFTINVIAGDDVINAAEAGASVTVSGTTTAEPGRTVTVRIDGTTSTATVLASGVWSVSVAAQDIANFEASELVTADVSDAAGNPATQASRTITVDTEAPELSINVIAGDDVINAAEAGASVTVSGTTTAEPGRTVTIRIDGTNSTATVLAGGVWSVSVAAQDIANFEASEFVTADVSDAAGNPAPQASRTITVDTEAPELSINVIAGDDVINADRCVLQLATHQVFSVLQLASTASSRRRAACATRSSPGRRRRAMTQHAP